MIEQAMVFALGFLIAGLAALAFVPAFWARAMRLARRRIEMQMPQSMQEILAERDQLRAEHALEHRRLEQKAENLNRQHAATKLELGRRVNEIVRLERDVTDLQMAKSELTGSLAAAERELSEATAASFAMSKALHDATGLHERKSGELAELVRAHDALNAHAQAQHTGLIALETHVTDLQMRLEDLRRELVEADRRLRDKSRETSLIADDLALAHSEIASLTARSEALQRKLDIEVESRAAQTLALAAAQEEASQRSAELRALTLKLELAGKNLEDSDKRHKEVALQRAQDLAASRNAERGFAEKLDMLRSEKAGLQGALEAARRECERLQQDVATHRQSLAAGADDLALARSEIASLTAKSESLQRKLDTETQRSAAQAQALNTAQEVAGQRSAELRALALKLELASKNLEDSDKRQKEAALQHAQDLAASRIAERGFAEQLEALRSEKAGVQEAFEAAQRECERLQKKLDTEMERGTAQAQAVADAREEASQRSAELRALALELDLAGKSLDDSAKRQKEVDLQHAQDLAASRDAERGFAEQLEALRHERAGVQAALEAARRECERLQRDLAAAHTQSLPIGAAPEGDALLRRSIHEIGAAIIKLAKGGAPAEAPQVESRSAQSASEDLRLG